MGKDCNWLKELSVEQCRQVVVNGQLVAVPQDGRHTVEVGRRRHEEAVLPRWSRGRAGTGASVSHGAAHLVGRHPRRVMDPLEKSLYPGGLKQNRALINNSSRNLEKTASSPQSISVRCVIVEFICNKHDHMTVKNDKESVRTLFTISLWVCLENHLDRKLFPIGCYSYWVELKDSLSQGKNSICTCLWFQSLVWCQAGRECRWWSLRRGRLVAQTAEDCSNLQRRKQTLK